MGKLEENKLGSDSQTVGVSVRGFGFGFSCRGLPGILDPLLLVDSTGLVGQFGSEDHSLCGTLAAGDSSEVRQLLHHDVLTGECTAQVTGS